MEGVVYSLRDGLELMRGLNVPIEEIRATGGGGRSALGRQMQADRLGSRLFVPIGLSSDSLFLFGKSFKNICNGEPGYPNHV